MREAQLWGMAIPLAILGYVLAGADGAVIGACIPFAASILLVVVVVLSNVLMDYIDGGPRG